MRGRPNRQLYISRHYISKLDNKLNIAVPRLRENCANSDDGPYTRKLCVTGGTPASSPGESYCMKHRVRKRLPFGIDLTCSRNWGRERRTFKPIVVQSEIRSAPSVNEKLGSLQDPRDRTDSKLKKVKWDSDYCPQRLCSIAISSSIAPFIAPFYSLIVLIEAAFYDQEPGINPKFDVYHTYSHTSYPTRKWKGVGAQLQHWNARGAGFQARKLVVGVWVRRVTIQRDKAQDDLE